MILQIKNRDEILHECGLLRKDLDKLFSCADITMLNRCYTTALSRLESIYDYNFNRIDSLCRQNLSRLVDADAVIKKLYKLKEPNIDFDTGERLENFVIDIQNDLIDLCIQTVNDSVI